MKKISIIWFLILLFSYDSMSQNLEIELLKKKQAHYDRNKDKIDRLIDWIFELKTKTDDEIFLQNMDTFYTLLRDWADEDLTEYDDAIRKVELLIKESIDRHNSKVKEKSRNYQNTDIGSMALLHESQPPRPMLPNRRTRACFGMN